MTKKEALAVVFSCAVEYKENLVDHSLLFLCQDKHKNTYCIEVTFNTSNFQHLTGFKTEQVVIKAENSDEQDEAQGASVKKKINAAHFFELCIDRRLSEDDFEFSEDGTTPLKMKVVYAAKKVEWDKIRVPEEYSYLLLPGAKREEPFPCEEQTPITSGQVEQQKICEASAIVGKKEDRENFDAKIVEDRQENELKVKREMAIKLHKMNMPVEAIAEVAGVDIEIVKQWITSSSI